MTDQSPVSDLNVVIASRLGTSSTQADAQESSTIREESNLATNKRELVKTWSLEVMEAMQVMSKVFCEEAPFRRNCVSPKKDLDYAFRRNVEHILSLYSIPIAMERNKVTPSLRGPAVSRSLSQVIVLGQGLVCKFSVAAPCFVLI